MHEFLRKHLLSLLCHTLKSYSFESDCRLLLLCVCQEIDREIVLEVLPDLFPNIEKQNSDLSRTIMFEVVDLPRNRPGNELEYKVSYK